MPVRVLLKERKKGWEAERKQEKTEGKKENPFLFVC